MRFAALIPIAFVLLCSVVPHQPRFDIPRVVLWAWERPEDLRFIDVQRVGVAFLAATALIARDGSVSFTPRLQRLLLPDGVAAIAVVRIESPPGHFAARPEGLLAGLSEIAGHPGVRGLQIDFDSRASERVFYKRLIESIRTVTSKPIGVTALVSWCVGDRWLDREPIGEAVPMFFRMGRTEDRNELVESSACRGAVGLSMDEAWPDARPASVGRVYLFNPRAWNRDNYQAAVRRIQEWK